jgi:stage II sporulation protein D
MYMPALATGQVRIRLFSGYDSGSAVFSVVEGKYELDLYNNNPVGIKAGEIVIITGLNDHLVVKTRNKPGIICDSLFISGKTDNDLFSLRTDDVRRFYSGNLHCYRDMGTLLFINTCDIESYVAGVVSAEGGPEKHIEYFKTQAVIARTYMYKYFEKHILDKYNLCDDTHCQAFNGISDDTVIIRAAQETRGQVILGPDSILIIAAFHSNCGGETAPAEDVWLTSQPYLKRIIDPFCTASRNAKWQKSMSLEEWTGYLGKMGYDTDTGDASLLNFSQKTRLKGYKAGDFSLPLRQIRTDLNLRSTFFSLSVEGDSVIFSGRGYGHGVGLCQEGAMVMAMKGFDYKQIINFYYTGVVIADIKNAVAE